MLVSGLGFSSTYESGPFKVSSLRFFSTGVDIRFDPEPASCLGGAHYRMHARLSASSENYSALVSTLIAAYTADQSFTFLWFSNEGEKCSKTHILNLDIVEYSHK